METNDTPVPNGEQPQGTQEPAADQSASTTPASPAEISGSPGPAAADPSFREPAAAAAAATEQTAAAPAETVVDLGGVKAEAQAGALSVQRQDDVGFVALTPAPAGTPSATLVGAGAATLAAGENGTLVSGDMEFVRARMHAIEAHALRWGGEIGVAIRNELGALMDHLGVQRPH